MAVASKGRKAFGNVATFLPSFLPSLLIALSGPFQIDSVWRGSHAFGADQSLIKSSRSFTFSSHGLEGD